MPDLLFVEVNASYSHSMLSYGMLRAFTERHAPEWKWHKIEFTNRSADASQLVKLINELRPEVIAATAYLFNIKTVLSLFKSAREAAPDTRLVLGGPEFLGDNTEFLKTHPYINAVMRGDESTFWKYLKYDIVEDGIYDGELDDLPSPHQPGYVTEGKPFWQIETSRGCAGRCTFCTSSLTRKVKYHSIERVRLDLEALRSRGFREIRVLDRTFNLDQTRAASLLKMFREEFPDMRFHLELEPSRLRSDFIAELTATPNLHVEAGVQSLDRKVLAACRRNADPKDALDGLEKLVLCGNFDVHADLIAGLPEQTFDSLLSDVKSLIKICPAEIQLEKLKILPGTDIRNNMTDYNHEPPYQLISNQFMTAGDMAAAERLSQMLESWFNAPQIHSAFAFAVMNDERFLGDFLTSMLQCDSLFSGGKPPLENRFRILLDFLKTGPSREVAEFASLAAGTDLKRQPVKLSGTEHGMTLWKNSATSPEAERGITAEFSGNVGECFMNPRIPWKPGKTTYLFKLGYGRIPSEIIILG